MCTLSPSTTRPDPRMRSRPLARRLRPAWKRRPRKRNHSLYHQPRASMSATRSARPGLRSVLATVDVAVGANILFAGLTMRLAPDSVLIRWTLQRSLETVGDAPG